MFGEFSAILVLLVLERLLVVVVSQLERWLGEAYVQLWVTWPLNFSVVDDVASQAISLQGA